MKTALLCVTVVAALACEQKKVQEDPNIIGTFFLVKGYKSAYAQWRAENSGPCPNELSELHKYMKAPARTDTWGNPLVMKCTGSSDDFEVISGGPDGRVGTEDDILSSQKSP
jgi:hypothetical protein